MRFSEVHAERRETRRDSKGNCKTHYVTFFQGLFFIADIHTQFHGVTYVLSEGVTGILGGLGDSLQSMGGKMSGHGDLVKMEDAEFERQFKVFSNHPVEARHLVSSRLMPRLLSLRERYGCNVSAVFIGGVFLMAVETQQNWFEPPSLSTPLDFEALGEVIQQLQSATGVVETLN
jgi:hypothetical protein